MEKPTASGLERDQLWVGHSGFSLLGIGVNSGLLPYGTKSLLQESNVDKSNIDRKELRTIATVEFYVVKTEKQGLIYRRLIFCKALEHLHHRVQSVPARDGKKLR